MEKLQIISLAFNSTVLLLSILISGLFVWKLNLKNKNNRLIFILYILYWMAPLLCREYTGQMHIHMQEIHDWGSWLFIPLIVYGLIGILWRPLNDIFAYKLKSRRNVIFLSLGIELASIIPFLAVPCFATNIIQSVGAGIGASVIGIFNLMFEEHCHHSKIYKTVSIVALPPILAEIISSALECIVTTCLTEGELGIYKAYTGVMKWLWIAAIFFIVASFIVALFIKEKPEHLYQTNKHKEIVKKAADWWVLILICVAGAAVLFVRWITVGPLATCQLIYMGYYKEVDIRFYEGYFTVLYALGQLGGTALAMLWLTKSKSQNHTEKLWLVLIACGIWVVYLMITASFFNIPVYYLMSTINGLAMGIIWPVLAGMVLNKTFQKTKFITPMGIFNTSLSIGISLGTFFACWFKGPFFDFEATETHKRTIEQFTKVNYNVNMVCVLAIVLVFVATAIAYIIHVKNPPKLVKFAKKYHATGETEI